MDKLQDLKKTPYSLTPLFRITTKESAVLLGKSVPTPPILELCLFMLQNFSKQKKIKPTAFFLYINRVFMPVIFRFSLNSGTSFQFSIKSEFEANTCSPTFCLGFLCWKRKVIKDSQKEAPQCFLLIWDLDT
ncbi:hypothetical protein ACOSP7_007382 [Xanthoceras sorbifolium]